MLAGISPSQIKKISRKDSRLVQVPLPRTFGVFLNQNKNSALADAAVRAALDTALDKQKIVDEIFSGYGAVLEGPIPPGILGAVQASTPDAMEESRASEPEVGNSERARAILSRNGWKFDLPVGASAQAGETGKVWTKKGAKLEFTLATVDEPELAPGPPRGGGGAGAGGGGGRGIYIYIFYPLS